jgi:uncharacterized protein YcnI
MPKPGWALEVQRATLASPYTSHGRTITEDVVRITWTAKTKDDYLPNAHYDEFVLVGQLPDKDGAMYWPVTQVCAKKAATTGLKSPNPARSCRTSKARPHCWTSCPARRVGPQSLNPRKETP